jgi:tetratricopeptide (TPR) repeat protein
MADEKPWFGEGPGNFGAGFRRRPVEVVGGMARWGLSTEHAHSEPLQAAAETGWAGLALWLIGLGAALSVPFRRASAEPAREAAAAAAAAMAVQLSVDNMLQIPGLALLFFSAIAVAGAWSPAQRRWPAWAAVGGLALALVAWVPRTLADSSPARAAALFPADSDPREDLAYSAMDAGRWDEADAHLALAEKLSPFNAVYPWRRAQLAAAGGRWDAAEAFSSRAAALEPGFLNDRVLRADALSRLGRAPEAREELAIVQRILRERGGRLGSSGYDNTVWAFDRAEYDRVAARAGR